MELLTELLAARAPLMTSEEINATKVKTPNAYQTCLRASFTIGITVPIRFPSRERASHLRFVFPRICAHEMREIRGAPENVRPISPE